ncbi:MAG: hypothetical protein RMJ33_14605 [Saprospiraceae bacterium]|nr:hypothetical protein [Saprospiraceae bacterium]
MREILEKACKGGFEISHVLLKPESYEVIEDNRGRLYFKIRERFVEVEDYPHI